MRITSARNRHIQSARKLSKRAVRDRERLFLVEGETAVSEAVHSTTALHDLFVSRSVEEKAEDLIQAAARRGARVHEVSDHVMRALSTTTSPPGIVAVASFVDVDAARLLEADLDLAVVLALVRDPGNAGTILRTAWAVGADAVFLSKGSVDIYNAKVVRASAGAVFNVPIVREVEVRSLIEGLGTKGLVRIAADPEAKMSYDEVDMNQPCAVVFGNEAWGVPDEVRGQVDISASIPMKAGAESLNVAIAAALFLFEAKRQRRQTHQ